MTNTLTGQDIAFSLDDLEFDEGGASQPIGTAHGVTLIWEAGEEISALGAWMDHSGFAVQMEAATIQGVDIEARYGLAGGDLAGTSPTGGATWLGLMVGTPATGSERGDRLVGTAALNYDMGIGALDAAFSGIKNIDRGRAHSTETVLFQDIPMRSDGTFQAGLTGNRIQGSFYGPGHAEAAGIFEQSNIVGAFGATR
ncbi:MAG: hypothetical protein OXI73_01870 [Rhodospirillales bacterium]|nr:hypothetical protein [Rhodospirillales bacterium]